MTDALYDRVGGEQFFTELVGGFYAGVAVDPILRPMYPDNLQSAERSLRLFLMQYFGGPTTYDAERGHPRLRMRHMPFVIDKRAKDAWLSRMFASLDAVIATRSNGDIAAAPIAQSDGEELRTYITETANFLVNHGGLSITG